MPRRLAGLFAAIATQAVALTLAHELVFLARWGSRYNEALVHAGHGAAWSAAAATSLALGGLLALVAVVRLAQLGILTRRVETDALRPAPKPGTLLRAWLRAGPRIALVAVVLLTLQENLERAAIGQAMPGVGILLTPEYANGLWIAVAVGLAVGLVVALVRWRAAILVARLRAARLRLPRATSAPTRSTGQRQSLPAESLLGRHSALRAPPAAAQELLPAG
jgi:hypothetical protein